MEKLDAFANKKKISASQAATEIIEEYFDYKTILKLDMVRDTKKTISACFDMVGDVDLQELTKIDTLEVIQSFKVMTNDYSFDNLTGIVQSWFKFSNYDLEEFEEEDYAKFVCHNMMSKNWNKHQADVFVNVYSNFGYAGMVDTYEINLLVFRIHKNRNLLDSA